MSSVKQTSNFRASRANSGRSPQGRACLPPVVLLLRKRSIRPAPQNRPAILPLVPRSPFRVPRSFSPLGSGSAGLCHPWLSPPFLPTPPSFVRSSPQSCTSAHTALALVAPHSRASSLETPLPDATNSFLFPTIPTTSVLIPRIKRAYLPNHRSQAEARPSVVVACLRSRAASWLSSKCPFHSYLPTHQGLSTLSTAHPFHVPRQ